MFSWSKKKETKRRGKPHAEENEFGIKLDKGPSDKQLEAELRALAGVDGIAEDELNLNEGEEDEEAELLRLLGGGRGKKLAKKVSGPDEVVGDVSADIQDIGEEDVEVDENDPELLGELLELTQPDDVAENEPESDSDSEPVPTSSNEPGVLEILKERLKMYKTAELKAKENNENSRARRFKRGIKTLEDLIKKAKAGKNVSENDIPPAIAMNLKPPPPPQPESPRNTEEIESLEVDLGEGEVEESENLSSPPPPVLMPEQTLQTLMERLKLYQTAEAKAKESGEITRARRFGRGIKTIHSLIKEAKAGKSVNPNDIPPEVALNLKPAPPPPPPSSENADVDNDEENEEGEMGSMSLTKASSRNFSPTDERQDQNVIQVLSDRLTMYITAEAKAKENGESTRARRFGRGVKSIQTLIKEATSGKFIPPDEIPPPIAMNLNPAPLVVQNEEEPKEIAVENDTLIMSPDISTGSPLKFSAVDEDEIELEDELLAEDIPQTVLEGLEQRIRIYKKLKEKAQQGGNSTLINENEKIIRIYVNAVKTYKNGGYVDVLKLPAPRGAPPIPIPFQIP